MQIYFAPEPGNAQADHYQKIDRKDEANCSNHTVTRQLLIVQRRRQWKQCQMVRDNLETDFVEVFHTSTQPRVVRARQAQVFGVEQIGEQEDVDEDVAMLDACNCKAGVDETSDQKDARVESLTGRCSAHAKIEGTDLCSNGVSWQILAIQVEQPGEEDWNKDESQEGQNGETTVDAIHVCAHAKQ